MIIALARGLEREIKLPRSLTCVYAGSIARRKNMFLTKIEEHLERLEVHVFGRNTCSRIGDRLAGIASHPLMEPDDFIATVEGDFWIERG